jgi:hypothetical protein
MSVWKASARPSEARHSVAPATFFRRALVIPILIAAGCKGEQADKSRTERVDKAVATGQDAGADAGGPDAANPPSAADSGEAPPPGPEIEDAGPAGDAGDLAELARAPVACESWVETVTSAGCRFVWASCSDGERREIRCDQRGDAHDCMCILGRGELSRFRSRDFCAAATSDPAVDQPIYTRSVNVVCGFQIGL